MSVSISIHRILVALILAASATNAGAATVRACHGIPVKWDSTTTALRANTISFPTASWQGALLSTVSRFNQNPSRFRYAMSFETGGVGFDNDQNELWMSSPAHIPQLEGEMAVTGTRFTCFRLFNWVFSGIKEIDIIFNVYAGGDDASPGTWSPSTAKSTLRDYGGGGESLRMVALHELGHGIGLRHHESEYNLMKRGPSTHLHVNGNWALPYVGEDAGVGAVYLYGAMTPLRRDVGVVHWRWQSVFTSSTHAKTAIWDTDGQTRLAKFNDDGEDRYMVNPGQRVSVEFTFENNGVVRENVVRVGYYVSSNDIIDTADTRIGGATLDLGPNDVYTRMQTVTIPASLAPGSYWLGVIVDDDGAIGEFAEWNNATYLPIEVCRPFDLCPLPEFPGLPPVVN